MPSERKAGSGLVTAVVREAQVHPWRTIEHCILIVLALHLTFNSKPVSAPICAAGKQPCCCSTDIEGPRSVFGLQDVSAAPQPTMSLADLKPGETVQHHDFRGDIYRLPLGDDVIVNLMRTTAGTLRSGDLHNCTQYDVILKGRAKLHTYDVETRQETAVVYDANEIIQIPARVPHLFEFLEENYMLEWWACDFAAWYYKPYRDRIAKSFAREKAAYDAAKSEEDGSISVAAAQQATSKAVSQEAGGSQEKAEGDQSFTRHELGQHNTGDARTGAQDQRKHAGAEAELATLGGSEEWGPRMRSAETADDGGSSEGVTGGGKNQDTQSGAADESRADVRRSKQGGTGQRERKARSADGAAATDAQQEGATGNKAVTEDDSEDWSR
mmetsp:Transcript_2503/g.7527  ORF Transcript_2503/g.7527 Transcript_2503/m.7527 type:complete len:384 (+) Transcript_2503:430-1581(+)